MFARGYTKVSSNQEDLVPTNQSIEGLGEELADKNVRVPEQLQDTASEVKLSGETMVAQYLPVDQAEMHTYPEYHSSITPRDNRAPVLQQDCYDNLPVNDPGAQLSGETMEPLDCHVAYSSPAVMSPLSPPF